MMGDLISREAAVNKLRKWAKQTEGAKSDVAVGAFYESAARYLERLPAVDAEPVRHGYWIPCAGESHIWYCSECGEKINYNQVRRTYKHEKKPVHEVNRWCRSCGAKMDADIMP